MAEHQNNFHTRILCSDGERKLEICLEGIALKCSNDCSLCVSGLKAESRTQNVPFTVW